MGPLPHPVGGVRLRGGQRLANSRDMRIAETSHAGAPLG